MQAETTKIIFLGETIGFWIQTGAFVLSAIAAVVVIWHSALTSKRRATIDLILANSANKEINSATSRVYSLHDAQTKLTELKEGTEDRRMVILVLNHVEFISLGIRRGAFDEKIYKELKCNDMLRLWDACGSLIEEIRSKKSSRTIFQEFELLVNAWRDSPLKCHKK